MVFPPCAAPQVSQLRGELFAELHGAWGVMGYLASSGSSSSSNADGAEDDMADARRCSAVGVWCLCIAKCLLAGRLCTPSVRHCCCIVFGRQR